MLKREVKSTSTNKAFEIVVITAEGVVSDEVATCNALFEAGLSKLHVRKPHASAVSVKALIQEIDSGFRNRIIVHEHHHMVQEMNLGGYHIKSTGKAPELSEDRHVSQSFHTFDEIRSCEMDLHYGFLSPIFDSLSKPGYSSRFSMESLKVFLMHKLRFPLIALGGITSQNVASVKNIGFQGAAILGSIWQSPSLFKRMETFNALQNQS